MEAKLALTGFIIALMTNLYSFWEIPQPHSYLEQMIKAMETEKIALSDWQVYTRGEVALVDDFESYQSTLRSLSEQTDGFRWHVSDDLQNKEHWRVEAERIHPALDFKERVTVLAYPQKNQTVVYMIYEGRGSSWLGNESELRPLLDNVITLFDQSAETFVTVSGLSDETETDVDIYEQATRLLDRFSSEKVEELNEETFVSISAYNSKWKQFLHSNDQKMNLQVAIREAQGLGGARAVTIGTPIITTEY